MRLSTEDHDRDKAGLKWVYAVVSRRSRGLSIGINLNPDNTCNWRCVYCQVPGLVFGNAPATDLAELGRELATLLDAARDPRWLAEHAPEDSREIRDVAIAGNGEPTSSRELEAVIEVVERSLAARGLLGRVPIVLITNGSLVHLEHVQRALKRLAALGGQVWFKLDVATDAAAERLNANRAGVARSAKNLVACASLCPTWVQTLVCDFDGPTLAGGELERYCELLCDVGAQGIELRGVLLYGLARPSHQPEASRLRALDPAELAALARTIRERTGLETRTHV